MYSILFLSISAFVVCFLTTPVFRDWFEKVGIVDRPDALRKKHARAVPRTGGIPIALAYTASFVLLLLTPLSAGSIVVQHFPLIWRLLPVAASVFLLGLVDDLRSLEPRYKLAGQIVASVAAWLVGVRILGVAGIVTPDWISLPLTVLWLVACTNALNLIDGLDGLASGIGLFATATTLIAALLKEDFALALATAPLAGALLAFLRYNFNPASIFLGDCGSLLIGFLLGCYGVLWTQKSATVFGMTAPLLVLFIPILDVLLSVARRFLRGRPIFAADRGHIHHRLLDRGLTPRRVALLLYAACFLGASLSLVQSVFEHRLPGLVLLLFAAITWIGIGKLGYIEFDVTKRVLLGGAVRRMLTEHIILRQMQDAIASAVAVEECWDALRSAARDFGFQHLRMRLCGEEYAHTFRASSARNCWMLRIPLREDEYVNCSMEVDTPCNSLGVAAFSKAVAGALVARAATLRPSLTVDPELASLAHSLSAFETAAAANSRFGD